MLIPALSCESVYRLDPFSFFVCGDMHACQVVHGVGRTRTLTDGMRAPIAHSLASWPFPTTQNLAFFKNTVHPNIRANERLSTRKNQ